MAPEVYPWQVAQWLLLHTAKPNKTSPVRFTDVTLLPPFNCPAIHANLSPRPETQFRERASACKARAEQAFWTPLTIQYGVTIGHDSDVKCCVNTETMGCHMNALGRAPKAQHHGSGHSDGLHLATQAWGLSTHSGL